MPYRDFEEFLALLDAKGARYLVVGAHAVAFHARPRATKDLAVFVDGSPENAELVLAAVHEFLGGVELDFSLADVVAPDTIIQLGVEPVRIDLLSDLDGVDSFAGAWERRVDGCYGEVHAHYLSLDDLIAAKRASGRPQDLADLDALERARAWREKTRPPST